MTAAKQLFQRKDPDGQQSLASWWTSVVNDDRFNMVLTCTRAELMEFKPKQDELAGAEMAIATLMTLAYNEESSREFPSPGLQHDFNPPKSQPEKKA